jgi:preprotein translocase subunit SecG
MQSVLIIIQLFVSVALVVVILLQRSEGGALGMGGGGGSGMGGFFSPRGAGDALSRTTAILAVLFFVASLGLTLLSLHGRPQQQQSILDSAPLTPTHHLLAPTAPAPAAPKPQQPQAPAVPTPH